MNRSEFIMLTAIILFGVFLIGWFAHHIAQRLARPTNANMGEIDLMAQQLHDTEQARDEENAQFKTREGELLRRIASGDADLQATMDSLRDARTEIEELREYIDKLRSR